MEQYYTENGDLDAHPTLGASVRNNRSRNTSIPQHYQQEMTAMGGIRPAKKRTKHNTM